MPQERFNETKVYLGDLHRVDLVPRLMDLYRMAAAQSKDKLNVTQSAVQSLRLDNLLEEVKKVRLACQFRDPGANEKHSSFHFCAASTSS